jgi:hypothetical protein
LPLQSVGLIGKSRHQKNKDRFPTKIFGNDGEDEKYQMNFIQTGSPHIVEVVLGVAFASEVFGPGTAEQDNGSILAIFDN